MNFKNRIGQRLMIGRILSKLSACDMASQLGIKEKNLRDIEMGFVYPTQDQVFRISEILEYDLDFFLDPLRADGEVYVRMSVKQ